MLTIIARVINLFQSWEEREEEAETSLSKLVNYIMPAPKFRG